MPRLIVIRLHPLEPINGADFTAYLGTSGIATDNLAITVKDIAFDAATGGVQEINIDTAEYLPPQVSNPPADPLEYNPATNIVQHFIVQPQPGTPIPAFPLVAVGTAVIEVPANLTEYDTTDLRLEITRGGRRLLRRNLDYNVALTPNFAVAPPPEAFANLEPISLYIALPPPGRERNPNFAYVELAEDGSAPNFAELKMAVETVLEDDPGGLAAGTVAMENAIAGLTPAQCQHIAYEIAFNRSAYPSPVPRPTLPENPSILIPIPLVPPVNPLIYDLAKFYTLDYPGRDDVDDEETEKPEQNRRIFEAELVSYRAERQAQAERLSGYVYALAAAIACQQRSEQATTVGFQFPVNPAATLDQSAGKIKQAEVILSNKP